MRCPAKRGRAVDALLLLLLHVLCIASARAVHEADITEEMRELLLTHMSTKTVYVPPNASEMEQETQQIAHAAQCRPVQLNYVIRHGTRFPTIKDITRINTAQRMLVEYSDESVLRERHAWIRAWKNPYDVRSEGWLAGTGVDELVLMGQRFRKRFGQAMLPHFDRSRYVFEHTWKPRTLQSAMAFAFGFFGGHQMVHYATDPIGQDEELRFFDNCPAFDRSIDHNSSATAEFAGYRQTQQMRVNLRRFRRLAANTKLTQRDLEAAYAACAFDIAVRERFDEWCTLFDEDMLWSMDYFHDLRHFYKKGHGNAMAFEIASPLLQDLHRSMKDRMQNKSRVEGHFRFAHAETILPLAALLDLASFDRHRSERDGHFLAATPLELAKRRQFHGSVLSPFAANIGFVLYECDDRVFRVQTLLHERTVRFAACDSQPLCPFGQFEAMNWQWIHEYDFEQECK